MNAKSIFQQWTEELLDLMRTIAAMHEASQRGVPMASLSAEQTQTAILTVGDALMTNHRAMRAKQNSGHVAA